MNHPYYILPIIEKYKTLSPDSEEASKLALLISVNIGDQETLESILNPMHLSCRHNNESVVENETLSQVEPINHNEVSPDSSMNTIDSFLSKFGNEIPTTGYLAQAHFDDPIKDNPTKKEGNEFPPAQEEDFQEKGKKKEFSELKNLIYSKRYKEALALIERQNLNNPQKSIYFAHQMRFIKKLMAIDNYKNKNKG